MNWKIKLSCKFLYIRIRLFLFILIVNKIANEETIKSDSIPSTTAVQLMQIEDDKSVRQLNFNNITTEDNADSEYPYEKLLELVKETKHILSSTNTTMEKTMLNLNPSEYQIYLRSTDADNQLHQTDAASAHKVDGMITILNRNPPEDSVPGPPSLNPQSSETGACDIVTESNQPRRLKSIDGTNQFVINLGNQFVQTWNIIKCLSPDKQCGIRSILPEMYESVCEQSYSGTAKFFSVPVGEEITLLKQEYRQFRIPVGCNCKLRMATSIR